MSRKGFLGSMNHKQPVDSVLRSIMEGTSSATGVEFFHLLVRHLAEALGVRCALVTKCIGVDNCDVRTLAFWQGDSFLENFTYELQGTPCETVIKGEQFFVPEQVQQRFPDDKDLVELGVQSYVGVPMLDSGGHVLGLLAVMDTKPMRADEHREWILNIFAARAAAEIERSLAEDSQQRLAAIVDSSGDAIIALDLDRKITNWNPGACRLFGYTEEEAIGQSETMLHPDDLGDRPAALFSRVQKGELLNEFPTVRVAKDGRRIDVSLSVSPIFNNSREIVGYSGIARDITERVRAENAIRDSERTLRWILDNMPDSVVMMKTDGTITFVNRIADGFSVDQIIGVNVYDFLPPKEHEELMQVVKRVCETGQIETIKLDSFDPSQEFHVYNCRVGAVSSDGEVTHIIAVATEVTEHERATRASEEAQRRYRLLTENMNDVIWTVDPDGLYTYVSPSVEKMTGFTPEETLGKNFTLGITDTSAETRDNLLEMSRAGDQRQFVFEVEHRRKDGSTFWCEFSAVVIYDDDRQVLSVQGVTRDIDKRKKAEDALRLREEQYRQIVETAQEGIYVLDAKGTITFTNERLARMLGREATSMVGRSLFDFIRPEVADRVHVVLDDPSGKTPQDYETILNRNDGTGVWISVSGNPIFDEQGQRIGSLGMVTDITESKEAEEERLVIEAQMQHTQKLESLGVLAGGIAHDFNNLLAGIMGYAGLAKHGVLENSVVHEQISKIETAAVHAADLTRQMLAYSGKGRFVFNRLDISSMVGEMADLFKASVSKKAELRFEFTENLPSFQGDSAQVQQVIMNLITNAADAIGDAEGEITIRTGVMYADVAYLVSTYLHEDLPQGEYVYVEVTDTGCGMTPATVEKIFDPFFTTKFTGRGLGLAAVLGIVRSHRGALRVDSIPGEGTTFRVLFPSDGQHVESERLTPGEAAKALSTRCEGTVLVVDDDELVLGMAIDVLEDVGFSVLSACDGESGVDVFKKHSKDIRVVVLDLTMPKMNGDEAFRAMRKIRSDVHVVLSSGYAEQEATGRFGDEGPIGFIQKPYLASTLVTKVRECIVS